MVTSPPLEQPHQAEVAKAKEKPGADFIGGARIMRVCLPENAKVQHEVAEVAKDGTHTATVLTPDQVREYAKKHRWGKKKLEEQLNMNACLWEDIKTLKARLQEQAGMKSPPDTFELMLSYGGQVPQQWHQDGCCKFH